MAVIPSAVQTARNAYVAAQANVVPALDAVEQAKVALEVAQRTADPDAIDAAQSNLNGATLNLIGMRNVANDARTALNAAIATWLQGTTPQTDILRLNAVNPIVFFPIRLETRFDRTIGPFGVLKVRIYPDDIFFDTHEAELTREEVTAATDYYNAVSAFPTLEEELPQWQQITRLMSPERAAYVLRAMEPARDTSGNIVSFPSPPLAPSTWNRPGEAIMPDRWVAVAYRRGQPTLTVTAEHPVREPLTLTVDPNTDPASAVDIPGSNSLLKMDERIAWTVDYDRAVAAGMAITIELRSEDEAAAVTGGFDRLIVFGVKTSMPPADVGRHLEKLLDNHHYTRGLALVRQGTPTNNTDESPTPLPRDGGSLNTLIEERGYVRFAERGGGAINTFRGGDAEILARFLGLWDGVFPNYPVLLQGNEPDLTPLAGLEQIRADAMNRATWAVTFGYVIDNMLAGTGIAHDTGRDYFKKWVRGRGPAPSFRIGMVPYGVLPVVSLARWAPIAGITDPVQNPTTLDTLKRMREQWRRAAAAVDRIKPNSPNPLEDLLKALALYPSAREVRVRESLGPTLLMNLAQLSGVDYQMIANAVALKVSSALYSLGRSSWATTLSTQLISNSLSSQLVTDLVVPPAMLSEDELLPAGANYIELLRVIPGVTTPPALPVAVLLQENTTFGTTGLEQTLLYKVLRHATLREAARLGRTLVPAAEAPNPLDREVNGARSIQGGTTPAIIPTFGQMLTRADFAVSGGKPLGDYVRGLGAGTGIFAEMYGAFGTLSNTPTAELDRLFAETLDLSSHRLDAWITSLATTRLVAQRAAQDSNELSPPLPTNMGGYAMLEDVRPASATAPNGGFIHGPSMAHASAAAVLRSGHLTYRTEDPQKYAIDLASERVRSARAILDAVRSGQPLGAVMGQRFERRLADRNPGANQYRYALRRYFPLVAGKETPLAPGEAADVVAARNVVDGLAMWSAFKLGQIPFSTAADLPSPTSPNPVVRQANTDITAEITALQEPIDAVADLVIAESVYHLTRGAVGSAAGHMDALARGSSPPDPEMGRSARGGIGVTQKVAMVFPVAGVVDQTPWSQAWPLDPQTRPLTPRARAEPLLDVWATGILGDPRKVSCAVILKDAAGATTTKVVTLFDLSFDAAGGAPLRPLDVLSMARAEATANQGSLLERFISSVALRNEPSRVIDRIDYARQDPEHKTFPEIMALALAMVELLAGARPLAPTDLAVPAETRERREEVETAAKDAAKIVLGRATSARNVLAGIRDDLAGATAGGIVAPLEAAAAYVPSARPAPRVTEAELSQIQGPIVAEIDRRLAAYIDLTDEEILAADAARIVAVATENLRVLFGRELLPLSAFPPPATAELNASFANRDELLGGADASPIAKFLQRASQVQAGIGRWRTLGLYLGAFRGPRARLDVAQLPYVAGERWAALPFAGETQPRGRVAFTLLSHETTVLSASVDWRGFVFDEWVDTVPQPTEQTGVAFHYDSPIAEAGQTILIAVPSSSGADWSYDDILATLNETLDLAKIRAVDAERVELGNFLPTARMTRTLKGATVSTTFPPGTLRVRTTGLG